MENILQDITVTIDLGVLDREKYQKIISTLKSISIEPLEIYTFNPVSKHYNITETQREFVENLQ